jgi:CDP-glucose 4,6-dehydratase
MEPDSWRDREVFLTGHTGFKGAWLTVLLNRLGARVHGFALETPSSFLFHRARIDRILASDVRGDVRDRAALADALANSGADVVLHLAAQSIVRESYRNPAETFSTNIDGTLSVLGVVLEAPIVTSCVVVTTDKVYRNHEWHWGYREIEPLGGDDPYSASKACVELVTHSMVTSFPRDGLGVATARAGNVIGGGDATPDALVPELVDAFATGRSAVLRNPEAVRPWQHVLEPLSGYLTLAEHLPGTAHDQGWNFGPATEDTLSVGEIADIMAGLWGGGASWTTTADRGPHEAGLLRLDSARAHADLSWRPVMRAHDALALTVDWERSVRSGEHPLDATLRQVDGYLDRSELGRRSLDPKVGGHAEQMGQV